MHIYWYACIVPCASCGCWPVAYLLGLLSGGTPLATGAELLDNHLFSVLCLSMINTIMIYITDPVKGYVDSMNCAATVISDITGTSCTCGICKCIH